MSFKLISQFIHPYHKKHEFLKHKNIFFSKLVQTKTMDLKDFQVFDSPPPAEKYVNIGGSKKLGVF